MTLVSYEGQGSVHREGTGRSLWDTFHGDWRALREGWRQLSHSPCSHLGRAQETRNKPFDVLTLLSGGKGYCKTRISQGEPCKFFGVWSSVSWGSWLVPPGRSRERRGSALQVRQQVRVVALPQLSAPFAPKTHRTWSVRKVCHSISPCPSFSRSAITSCRATSWTRAALLDPRDDAIMAEHVQTRGLHRGPHDCRAHRTLQVGHELQCSAVPKSQMFMNERGECRMFHGMRRC